MSQNIYDDLQFFEGYSRLDRSVHGLDGAAEWPAIQAMLPDMRGLDVADLGCGFGWFCRWARQHGAAGIDGYDISENMLARARADTADPDIRYHKADLERLTLPKARFDLVYSSLAFHYIEDIGRLLETIHQSLKSDGALVFSTEHPIYMAPTTPGWIEDGDGRKVWPVDGYQIEGPRQTNWLAEGVIKHHRMLGTTINHLIGSGFVITHVEEWAPSDDDLAAHPEWSIERDRPMFLLISARRRSDQTQAGQNR
jgi:ubiquinone/menaquinone biosynthesis C-methylase UbiE